MTENPKIILAVLLAEDEANDAELLIGDLLVALPLAKVDIAVTSTEIYLKLAAAPSDLVLLDLALGEGDNGEQLVRNVRQRTNAPIIVVTGDDSLETIQACIRAGADAFMFKRDRSPDHLKKIITMAVTRRETFVLTPMTAAATLEADRVKMGQDMEATRLNSEAILETCRRITTVIGLPSNGTAPRKGP